MAINIASLRTVRADKPPRILIYGPPKMGKTTLGSEFPDPVFIQTEDGASGDLQLNSFGHLTTYGQVEEAMGSLATDEHSFKTLVVDSISELEKLMFAEACTRNKWATIEQPGYGRGYKEVDYVWGEFMDALNYLREQRGMTVVLLGHSVTERFDDPETQSYSRYDIALHKGGKAIIEREVDAILLIKKDVTIKTEGPVVGKGRARADGGDSRWIYTQGRPAYNAGNRYNMTDRLLYAQGKGYAVLAPFLPKQASVATPATETTPQPAEPAQAEAA